MKTKSLPCSFCPYIGPLFRRNPDSCTRCAQKHDAIVRAAKKAAAGKFKQATITQTEDGKTAKAFKYIPQATKNRQAALAKYRRLRDKYFEQNPVCEFPGCNSRKITLHHKRGRIGAFLTDKRFFCSLCHIHHRFVEENPLEAKKLSLSDSRLSA